MSVLLAGCVGVLSYLVVGRILRRSDAEVRFVLSQMVGALVVLYLHDLRQGTFSALGLMANVVAILVVGTAFLLLAKRTRRHLAKAREARVSGSARGGAPQDP